MYVNCRLGRLPFSGSRTMAMSALVLAFGLSAGNVYAALPAPVSYEYFGLNFADNIVTSDAVGTLTYTGGPGCGGICTATTSLGADPSETIDVDQVIYEGTGG